MRKFRPYLRRKAEEGGYSLHRKVRSGEILGELLIDLLVTPHQTLELPGVLTNVALKQAAATVRDFGINVYETYWSS